MTDHNLGAESRSGFGVVYHRSVVVMACGLVAAIVGIMLANVFFRFVLSDAIIWAEDICRILLIWLTFLFLGAALARGGLVAVELLTGRLGPRGRALCLVPAYLLCIALLVTLVWYGWRFANVSSTQTIPAADHLWRAVTRSDVPLNLSIFWVYIAVPIGCAALALHMVGALMAQVRPLFASSAR